MKKGVLAKSIILDQRKEVITISGIHSGIGVTHTALMLAFFTKHVRGRKVSYIEINQSNQIKQMVLSSGERKSEIKFIHKDHELGKKAELDQFNYEGIQIYPNMTQKQYEKFVGSEFETLILDLGMSSSQIRGDLNLVVADGCLWKRRDLEYYLRTVDDKNQATVYMLPFMNQKEIRTFHKTYHEVFCSIPYQANPFSTTPSIVELFQRLLLHL